MTKSTIDPAAEETRRLRLKMYRLMTAGLNESQALLSILPNDSARRDKLNLWKSTGLWPPPEAEDEAVPGQVADLRSPSFDFSEMEIPEAWLQRMSGMINTTVNAAILDYHNVQSDQTEKQVETRIREKLQESSSDLEFFRPEKIVELVKATVQDMVADLTQPSPKHDDHRVAPPRPRTLKGTRKLAVPRRKLQGTCDAVLFELFEEEREARGFNVSQMIDFILYNHYGQPDLSFEAEDGVRTSEDEVTD